MTMFHVERRKRLAQTRWKPQDAQRLYYIETKFTKGHVGNQLDPVLEHGYLEDRDVVGWVDQKSPSRTVSDQVSSDTKLQGGFRLLVCPGSNISTSDEPSPASTWEPRISERSFAYLESKFRLCSATLPSLFTSGGVFAQFSQEGVARQQSQCVRTVIKFRRKDRVGDWLLSICYDCASAWTYGFLCGEDLPLDRDDSPRAYQLCERLEAGRTLWSEPLLLPTTLMQIYCEAIVPEFYKNVGRLTQHETAIGVTQAGKARSRSLENWPDDIDIKEVTIGLHSTGTKVLFLNQTCCWAKDCLEYLIRVLDKSAGGHDARLAGSSIIRETLHYEKCRMEWISRTMQTAKERVQTQSQILFSAASQKENAIAIRYSRMQQEQTEIAQKDVQLNTRIATSTKRDSIAMTTFTFITALFLPGTYISSLFSMSMFQWLDSGESQGSAVSAKFWIYWCITIPLTAIVMSGWVLWYHRADIAWQKETGFHLDGSTKKKFDDDVSAVQLVESGVKI